MREDQDEELQRLEEELLMQETPDAENMQNTIVFSAHSQVREVPRVRSTDHLDVDLDAFSREVESPARHRKGPIVVAFIVLTAVFLCVVLWWALRMRGMIG